MGVGGAGAGEPVPGAVRDDGDAVQVVIFGLALRVPVLGLLVGVSIPGNIPATSQT